MKHPQEQAELMVTECQKILSPHVQITFGLSVIFAIKEANAILKELKLCLKENDSSITYWEEVLNQLKK
jgi:hypothetical protein